VESLAPEAQRSRAATKAIVVSHGFAACCEEWLCLSVELAFRLGCAPILEASNSFTILDCSFQKEYKSL
jgi:hypothetical protein